MPKPRSSQISLIDTAYYRCVSRCVRRAFLCGTVAALLTNILVRGTSYEHRQAWVEDKVLWLSSVFAIGICAYAVMSNHVHLVLCVDKDKAMSCIQKRTEAIQQHKRQPHKLLPFVGNPTLPFRYKITVNW
jgi:REP element-mobilizing transposase RayT